jgi:ABC-type antimicrobial peptide transport system ATPase subunit
MDTDVSVMQDDLAAVLRALGLGDHARPVSPHEVMRREVLPAIERLQLTCRCCSRCPEAGTLPVPAPAPVNPAQHLDAGPWPQDYDG